MLTAKELGALLKDSYDNGVLLVNGQKIALSDLRPQWA